MNVNVETEGDLVIVRPVGKMDALTAPVMQEAVDEIMQKQPPHVVIDMADVPYISSAGLRVFIRAAKSAQGSGKLAVCRLNDNVRQVFELAGFDKIMNLCDDLETAKSSA